MTSHLPFTAQQCQSTHHKTEWCNLWRKTLTFTLSATHSVKQPVHLHTVQVDELTLPLVAFIGQEVFKVFDLLLQLGVQIELCRKLRNPVPGRKGSGKNSRQMRLKIVLFSSVCVV